MKSGYNSDNFSLLDVYPHEILQCLLLQVRLLFVGNTLPSKFACTQVYRIHVYFHASITLHHLWCPLPDEDSFSKVKISYNKNECYSTCDG